MEQNKLAFGYFGGAAGGISGAGRKNGSHAIVTLWKSVIGVVW